LRSGYDSQGKQVTKNTRCLRCGSTSSPQVIHGPSALLTTIPITELALALPKAMVEVTVKKWLLFSQEPS
jgi:hypothetical protein